MQIRVNGQEQELPDGLSVTQLLQQLKIQPERVVVELNLAILKRAQHPETALKTGDQVEIVQFVGGGSRDWRGFDSGRQAERDAVAWCIGAASVLTLLALSLSPHGWNSRRLLSTAFMIFLVGSIAVLRIAMLLGNVRGWWIYGIILGVGIAVILMRYCSATHY